MKTTKTQHQNPNSKTAGTPGPADAHFPSRALLAGLALVTVSPLLLSGGTSAAQNSRGPEVQARTAESTTAPAKPSKEAIDRQVDQVALSSSRQAVTKIEQLIRKYRNTPREAALLIRLADVQQQAASIHFRVAHGKAHSSGKSPDLKAYKGALDQSVGTLDRLITRFPKHDDLAHAFFLRANAYKELENKKAARRDYTQVTSKYPDAPEAIPSYMALADYAIEDGMHSLALRHLEPVVRDVTTPYHPFALYKAAWSHFNLRQTADALGFIEKHVTYYNKKRKAQGRLSTSDESIWEKSLADATAFYLQGFEAKEPRFALANAREYFTSLESGPQLGKMLVRFARLLRSHRHEQDLLAWKDEILAREIERPEAIEVVLTVLEDQYQRQKNDELVKTLPDLVKVYRLNREAVSALEGYPQAQKLILNTAERFRKLALRNKATGHAAALGVKLASVYRTFIDFVPENDPRVPGVHFNLAETLFAVNEFEPAVRHYRWIYENLKDEKIRISDKSTITRREVSLRAISARYQSLQASKLIPASITPVSFDDARDDADDSLKDMMKAVTGKHAGLGEWMAWIDRHVEDYGLPNNEIESFMFDANRTVYSMRYIHLAAHRLRAFAEADPKSRLAIPSAMLVLDTHVKSERWEALYELAVSWSERKEWSSRKTEESRSFSDKLASLSADAYFKTAQLRLEAGDNEEALDRAERLIRNHPASARAEDALFLAATAATRLGKLEVAQSFYGKLVERHPSGDNAKAALLRMASYKESRHELLAAARDYRAYVKLNPSDSSARDLKTRALELFWLEGATAELSKALDEKGFCEKKLTETCDRYEGLLELAAGMTKNKGLSGKKAFQLAWKGTPSAGKANRAIWTAVALERMSDLPFPDRLVLIRIIASAWEDAEPDVRFVLLPYLSRSIPEAFRLNREALKRYSKIQHSEQAIASRIAKVKEMEDTAARAMKLPWARIRAEVMNEIAGLYLDFTRELSGLQVPESLSAEEKAEFTQTISKVVLPFEEKAQEIRLKALETAANASVERELIDRIAKAYLEDNPSQSVSVLGEVPVDRVLVGLDEKLLETVAPKADWDDIANTVRRKRAIALEDDNLPEYLRYRWLSALRGGNPSAAFHFLGQLSGLKGESTPSDAEKSMLRALMFAAAGAQSEALAEVAEARDDLEGEARVRLTFLLANQALASLSKDRTRKHLEDLEDSSPEKRMDGAIDGADEAFVVAYGATWASASLEEANLHEMLNEASGSSVKEWAAWARKSLLDVKAKQSMASHP